MKRTIAVAIVALGLGAFLFGTLAVSTVEAKRRPPMSAKVKQKVDRGGAEKIDVIVTYYGRPSFADRGRARALGARTKREYQRFPMSAMQIPAGRLNRLAANPRVRSITLDAPVTGMLDSAKRTALFPEEGSPGYVVPSSDMVVAVLDSGVGIHTDINLTQQIDIIPPATTCVQWDPQDSQVCTQYESLYDPYGHGTHVAGIVSGTSISRTGFLDGASGTPDHLRPRVGRSRSRQCVRPPRRLGVGAPESRDL